MIEASVVLDSTSGPKPYGNRLTTFKLRYPKFIHGEFMTHRVFSRNASSSRAIPTKKLLEEVRSDGLRAAPVWWGKNQAGMQAAEELDPDAMLKAQDEWRQAAFNAADSADIMLQNGVHKQIVNRILEPFSHINVVCSATEYDNFFGLRLDKAAQPEMRTLAEAMWKAYSESTPKALSEGFWHLPFVEMQDWDEAMSASVMQNTATIKLIHVSVARCARVSFESFETGKRSTVGEDTVLFDKLMSHQPIHASPAEHQATPDSENNYNQWNHGDQHANFKGWRQYRKMFPGEDVAPLPEAYR